MGFNLNHTNGKKITTGSSSRGARRTIDHIRYTNLPDGHPESGYERIRNRNIILLIKLTQAQRRVQRTRFGQRHVVHAIDDRFRMSGGGGGHFGFSQRTLFFSSCPERCILKK